jgi:DNA-binding transcriptional regulator GbsR (MarR family)
LANIVAKVFLGGRTKFFRAADAFYERRREGPYRFIQNRPRISVVALKSNTAAEKSKDQLSRDFPGRSIFDFRNNISQKQTFPQSSFSTTDVRRSI